MSIKIGFVLLVNPFNRLDQTERLIAKLNRMFNHPPIACHLDFGKNPDIIKDCPANVQWVRPHVDTKWADFSCIDAAVSALRLLYSGSDKPDWFIYLSGSDYPIKPAARILGELAASPFDAHIQHLALKYNDYPTWWEKICYKRHCSVPVRIPWITRQFKLTTRTFLLQHPFFTRGRIPYNDYFKCYVGEAWFCANYRAAQAILDFYDNDHNLAPHCRMHFVPEETYFHTVLANNPDLKLSQNYLRYVDWSVGGSNPKVLQMEDLPKLVKSGAHFARKFDEAVDAAILDEMDNLTL